MTRILSHLYERATRGHYGKSSTIAKVWEATFSWPSLFKDTRAYVATFDNFQKAGNISKKDQIPLNSILVCEVFDVWGIDFLGQFYSFHSYEYILAAINYFSK